MTEVIIRRKKDVVLERLVKSGDLILIDNDPYLASCIRNDDIILVGLEDGNRWLETPLKENSTEKELIEYIHEDCSDGYDVELIKDGQYKISVEIE